MDIGFELRGLIKILQQPSKAGAFVTLRYGAFIVTARGDQMAYTLPNGMAVQVKIAYQDASGNPAKVDGEVRWDTSDPALLTVQVDAGDTMNAVVATHGKVGQGQVTATADADLGEGVRSLVTIMDVDVVAGEAVAGTITPVGAPTPIGPEQRR
jgi:hypothetical protein